MTFDISSHDVSGAEFRPEKLVNIKEAAKLTGIHYFKLNRAAKQGLIPTYSLLNSRRLVRVSEVLAVIDATRQGGL